MKLTSAALLIAPLLAFLTSTAAAPNPEPVAVPDDVALKAKLSQIQARGITDLLEARAPVGGTVNADGVRYRRCPNTGCDAVGQYNRGQRLTIICRIQGERVNPSWPWWDRLDNGFYIYDAFVDWSDGVAPDVCP